MQAPAIVGRLGKTREGDPTAMSKNYPDIYEHLNELMGRLGAAAPEEMEGFSTLHTVSTADGALSTETKELIALAIGIAVHCDGCIAYHVHDALGAGASREEVVETIGVAVMMGGGPSVVYGCEALEALEQFEAQAAGAATG
jgi:AhpD family alkylhydroperoxidase